MIFMKMEYAIRTNHSINNTLLGLYCTKCVMKR